MKILLLLLFGVSYIATNHLEFTKIDNLYGDPLNGIIIASPDHSVPYDRTQYDYGVDADGDGFDTRAEMLIKHSINRVSFAQNSKRVKIGNWFDPYTGVHFKNANDVDIDHLVPLYEVHISGGHKWSDDQKRAFANDLGPQSPLRITHRWTNRVPKSADDPSHYTPSYVPGRCAYLKDWIMIKRKWDLSMDEAEANAIRKQYRACV